jgi:zinc protease
VTTAAAGRPTRAVLDNGLVVVARPQPRSRSVAIHLVLQAGAAFDPDGREGLAGFVAMLLDRGAGDRTAREIALGFDRLGATFQAAVRRDTIGIECRCLPGHLEEVLGRLGILVASPTFPADEVERARGLILTALAERAQDTAAVAEETLLETLFPAGHPYHAPRLGRRAAIEAIGRDDLRRFHARQFEPGGAVLALAGVLDPGIATAAVERTFGAWRGAPDRRGSAPARPGRPVFPAPPPPDRLIAVRRTLEGKSQADIALGFPGLRRDDPGLVPAMVFNCVLGEFGLGGRLGREVREKAGLAYYAFSRFAPGLGPGPLTIRSGVTAAKVDRAVALIDRTLAQVARRGFRPAEVRDARTSLAASVPREMETNDAAAATLALAEFYGQGIDFPDRLPGLIRAVTQAQVEDCSRRHLTPGRQVRVIAGPGRAEGNAP